MSVVIIGAGDCGSRAAFALRENGYIGSICLLGEEPGLPYERPNLSKPDIEGAIEKRVAPVEKYQASDIDLVTGVSAVEISLSEKRVKCSDGRSVTYDKLLLATGGRPRRLANIDHAHLNVFRSRGDATEVFAKARTAQNIVIVGAGLIGLELAAALIGGERSVTVIEAGPEAAARALPVELSRPLVEIHRQKGVQFLFETSVESVSAGEVIVSGGLRIPTDLTISAIGIVANTELAEAAGIDCQNGIKVDAQLRTSAPDVFAAGDCASVFYKSNGQYFRREAWRSALEQADIAVLNILGKKCEYDMLQWFWTDQFDRHIQCAGDMAGATQMVKRDLGDGAMVLFYLDAQNRLSGAYGTSIGTSVAKIIKISERLINKCCPVDPVDLIDASFNLKRLL